MKIFDWSDPQDALSFHTQTIINFLGLSDSYQAAEQGLNIKDPSLSSLSMAKWPLRRTQEVLSLFPARPEKVQLLESVDSLFRRDSKLWPELILPMAMKRAIRRRIQTLDLRMTAYVISHDVSIRPLVSTAIGLGFSHVCLVSHDQQYLDDQKKFIERRLIGVKLETVLTGDLTLQPQNAGFLLNTLNLNDRKESLQDIAYFNFMGSNAIFVDVFEGGPHKTLHEEASRAQLTCIRPIEVEWAWWVEALKKLDKPILISDEKEKEFFQNLDQGLIT